MRDDFIRLGLAANSGHLLRSSWPFGLWTGLKLWVRRAIGDEQSWANESASEQRLQWKWASVGQEKRATSGLMAAAIVHQEWLLSGRRSWGCSRWLARWTGGCARKNGMSNDKKRLVNLSDLAKRQEEELCSCFSQRVRLLISNYKIATSIV